MIDAGFHEVFYAGYQETNSKQDNKVDQLGNYPSNPKNDSKVVLIGRRFGQSLALKFSTCSKYCSTNSGQRVKLTCRKSGRSNEKRSQLIVMLAAVIAAYFCCLLPFNAVVLWAILWPSTFEAFDSDKRKLRLEKEDIDVSKKQKKLL
uniref:Uncharacterized protein n=1 Tax=Romanomermis culicivorax TaxID=13658 RepID=A0A915JVR5_ROMCU